MYYGPDLKVHFMCNIIYKQGTLGFLMAFLLDAVLKDYMNFYFMVLFGGKRTFWGGKRIFDRLSFSSGKTSRFFT